jgi:erythromycin esterase
MARGHAEASGSERPASYYELRDEWMARAVAALADSIAGPRKVVVWLHNDHARYGRFELGGHEIRSAGDFLRERYGEAVFSIGFFMGRGTIADNGRNEHPVALPDSAGVERFLAVPGTPASYLIMRGNSNPAVQTWAGGSRGYLRMGTTPLSLVPAAEFDALVYVDSVGPPNYRLPPP